MDQLIYELAPTLFFTTFVKTEERLSTSVRRMVFALSTSVVATSVAATSVVATSVVALFDLLAR